MQRIIASSVSRSISRGSVNIQMRRTIRRQIQKNFSSTARLAIANEISSLRLMSVVNGLEEGMVRGWDLCADDDGG
eukprot:CAMPEP_0204622026 /NCGR_PEP_ID=MMETSP0717-20131115/7693_1 /ASSEMBLY_ACC=CAM_ASM_000666 /TAXON_ID=230516 /ORGANISM="Chaetoceros curvisetus" /LENGTH=75 /DNA_ID=CAMNT_0051636623 /DNA_START=39 /DNA_END=266 /DNA_ORIENTATION=+